MWDIIRSVPYDWNIYDLLKPVPKQKAESMRRRLEAVSESDRDVLLMHHLLRSDPLDTPFVGEYLNSPEVRKALHIPSRI